MIRQARNYLLSAVSGATLIAVAIVAFVGLITAQVFTDWPLAALGGRDDSAVSDARPLAAGPEGGRGAGGAAATGDGAEARRGGAAQARRAAKRRGGKRSGGRARTAPG